jgi:hypothetical protein
LAGPSKDKKLEGVKRVFAPALHTSRQQLQKTLGIRAVSVRSHRLFKPPACVWLGCEMSNSLLYLASGMVKFCDKQSTSTDSLLGGAVSPEKGQRTVLPLHRLRCGSERSPPSLDSRFLERRDEGRHHGFQTRNFRPFPRRLLRRFCTPDCLRPGPRCRKFTVVG